MTGEKNRVSALKVELDIPFKGNRDYLQGGDIFLACRKAIAEYYPAAGIKRLELKELTGYFISLNESCSEEMGAVIGSVTITSKERVQKKLYLTSSSIPVTRRIKFDENDIQFKAKINSESISSCYNEKYKIIESVISLTKLLNQELDAAEGFRWIVVQIDVLNEEPLNPKNILIKRESVVRKVFSINDVYIDGNKVYRLSFCKVEK